MFLEEPMSSLAAKIFCFVYTALAIVSTMIVIIWNQEWARVDAYLDTPLSSDQSYFDWNETVIQYISELYDTNKMGIMFAMTDPHIVLLILDLGIFTVFIIETVLHFLVCPCKRRYLHYPYNVVRVALIVFTLIATVFEMKKSMITTHEHVKFYIVCKSMGAVRLLLIFRLRKLYRGLDIMLLSLESSSREFVLLLFAFVVCIVIYGIMLFAAEAEKDNFQNVFTAMWWALITMTTIGYGDYYPTTALGYCVGAVCAINGLIVLALPIAALASNFSNFYSHHSNMQKHENEINMQMTNKMTVGSVESLQTTKGDNQQKH